MPHHGLAGCWQREKHFTVVQAVGGTGQPLSSIGVQLLPSSRCDKPCIPQGAPCPLLHRLVTYDGVLFERVLQGTRVWAAKCLVRIFVLVIATVSSSENVLHMNCNGLCGAFRCGMLQTSIHRITLKIVYVAISREGMCITVNVCPAAYPGQRWPSEAGSL
jgi:hypothetical protein